MRPALFEESMDVVGKAVAVADSDGCPGRAGCQNASQEESRSAGSRPRLRTILLGLEGDLNSRRGDAWS